MLVVMWRFRRRRCYLDRLLDILDGFLFCPDLLLPQIVVEALLRQ
jgi:hypothetical protein